MKRSVIKIVQSNSIFENSSKHWRIKWCVITWITRMMKKHNSSLKRAIIQLLMLNLWKEIWRANNLLNSRILMEPTKSMTWKQHMASHKRPLEANHGFRQFGRTQLIFINEYWEDEWYSTHIDRLSSNSLLLNYLPFHSKHMKSWSSKIVFYVIHNWDLFIYCSSDFKIINHYH